MSCFLQGDQKSPDTQNLKLAAVQMFGCGTQGVQLQRALNRQDIIHPLLSLLIQANHCAQLFDQINQPNSEIF